MPFRLSNRAWAGLAVASVALVVVVTAVYMLRSGSGDAPEVSQEESAETVSVAGVPPVESSETPPTPPVPRYVPPPTHDPALQALVNRKAKIRVPSDITSRLPKVKHPEDVPVIVDLLTNTEEDDVVRNEAANLLRRSDYARLGTVLVRVLENPKEKARFRSFAIQHLSELTKGVGSVEVGTIAAVLHRALDDRDIPVRREALLALVRMNDPRGRNAAIEWLTADNSDGLRGEHGEHGERRTADFW